MTSNVPVVRPAWPTQPVPPGPQQQQGAGYTYPAAPPPLARATHRFSHSKLISALLGGIAGVVVIMVATSLIAKTPATAPCVSLVCFVHPPVGGAVENGTPYSNPEFKFTARILSISGIAPGTSTTNSGFQLTYNVHGEAFGVLSLEGLDANGQTAEQIVESETNKVANGAKLAYVIPGAMIGYQPGYGAAYDFSPNSGNGTGNVDRVIVLASIRNGIAIVAVASGPKVQYSGSFPNGQLSIADSAIAPFADPILNTVLWPGQPPF